MKARKEQMWKDIQAQDAALTEQVAKMNNEPQDKKMGLMAGVITRMVEQRSAMDVSMEKMQGQMMTHMMQHIQTGQGSMSPYPMMKEMKGLAKQPMTAPTEHPDQPK
jgi:hypothetical protein